MRIQRVVFGFVTTFVLGVAFSVSVGAVDSGVQSYDADSPIDNGRIVQLVDKNSDRVKVATQENLKSMLGVVVDRSKLTMALTNEELENEVFVAVAGTYNVLVSDQGGPIEKGDYLTLSAINGVAMKAGYEEGTVFGRAGADFTGKDDVNLGSTSLKDVDGKDNKRVYLGSIPVTIDIRGNPNEQSTMANVPEPLQRIGQQIAEKEVSPIRIYLSMAITAVTLITALVIIYSGVRNGVISIGRNPMSKKSIFRALTEIILTSFLILTIGLFAVYLLLRL